MSLTSRNSSDVVSSGCSTVKCLAMLLLQLIRNKVALKEIINDNRTQPSVHQTWFKSKIWMRQWTTCIKSLPNTDLSWCGRFFLIWSYSYDMKPVSLNVFFFFFLNKCTFLPILHRMYCSSLDQYSRENRPARLVSSKSLEIQPKQVSSWRSTWCNIWPYTNT